MPNPQGKPTLDDIFRAKRNEQPAPEFWDRFDREFKQKQKVLIQRRLGHEISRRSPLLTPLFRVGTGLAVCACAAFAFYLAFQVDGPSQSAPAVASQSKSQASSPRELAHFEVAPRQEKTAPAAEVATPALSEFAAYVDSPAPRLVVREHQTAIPAAAVAAVEPAPASDPTLEELAAQAIAQLEPAIQGARFSDMPERISSLLGSNETYATFETPEPDPLRVDFEESFSSIQSALMLGKYADPLTGTLSQSDLSENLSNAQNVSFSKIERALSQQRSRDRSIDSLSVSF